MENGNYRRQIKVAAAPPDVYRALTEGYGEWWTRLAGRFGAEGDVVRFNFSGRHGFWTFKAITLASDRIELECIDAKHIHPGQPKEIETEWLGTHLRWTFEAAEGGGTVVRFEHDGLTPDLLCYEICSDGWDMFFVDSLKSYLDTGQGAPFRG